MTLELYSGVVLNQNAIATGLLAPDSPFYPSLTLFPSVDLFPAGSLGSGSLPSSALYPAGTLYPALAALDAYQTFQLPSDYARGDVVPPLTGFQLCVNVASTDAASMEWSLDQLINGTWVSLTSGATIGAPITGQVWMSVYFPEPVGLDSTWATDTYRIAIAQIDGLAGIYFTSPNPLTNGQAINVDGTPLLADGQTLSFLFRVLGATADSGTDFLGNLYRSVAVKTAATNIATTGDLESYWMSQPSPSQFGVENLYLDMRSGGDPVVLDRMTLDPLTPGVYAHIYYSNDPRGPGVDNDTWDNLLWTPAYLPVQMTRQQTYAFPQPLTAKYIKVEFTNLQPRSYDPGLYQVPCTFRKFPQWVLDFFLGQFTAVVPDLLSSGVDVTYDALDLAYSYYTGDLNYQPTLPALATGTANEQNPALFQPTTTGQVDPVTLAQIRLAFRPFTAPPGLQGDTTTMLGALAASTATSNYSTETIQTALGNTSLVSNSEREALLVEKAFPPMFFFLPCRHGYRVSQAMFERNIGYYAGVRQLAFHRDVYTTTFDHPQYNEVFGDGTNIAVNDWVVPVP